MHWAPTAAQPSALMQVVMPESTPLRDELYGNLAELSGTAAFQQVA